MPSLITLGGLLAGDLVGIMLVASGHPILALVVGFGSLGAGFVLDS